MAAWCIINLSTRANSHFGWFASTTIGDSPRLATYFSSTQITRNQAGQNNVQGLMYSANVDYPAVVIARDTDGDAAAEEYQAFAKVDGYWRLLWVTPGQNDASMYPGFSNLNSVGSIDEIKVKPMPSSLFNPSIQLAGAQSAGQTWVAPDGDFYLQFTLTTRPSAGSVIVQFRKRDANNYWSMEISSTGVITLKETIAGVTNTRGTPGGAAVNGSIINLIAIDTRIQVFIGTTPATSYSTDVSLMREVNGGLTSLATGGAVSNIRIWKRMKRDESGLGAELIINGDFDTDSDWTKGAGWSIPGGAGAVKVAGSATYLLQDFVFVVGRYYEFTFTATVTAGSLTIYIGYLTQLPPITASGTYTFKVMCSGHDGLEIGADAAFAGTIDDISAKEILFTEDSLATQLDGAVNG
jgi:hypothetical protein